MVNMRKSTLFIISGIAMLVLTATACGSGAESAKPATDSITTTPSDTPPAAAVDTTHMDTATTRPVKGTN